MCLVFEYGSEFLAFKRKTVKKGFPRRKTGKNTAGGVLIPVDPPCANFQFATMEGRELTCGDFHACGISAAAGL